MGVLPRVIYYLFRFITNTKKKKRNKLIMYGLAYAFQLTAERKDRE